MDQWLRIPYVLNILILVPVCWSMFGGRGAQRVFQNAVEGSQGLERLVGSLWLAILVASVAGIAMPRLFWPVLAIQIVYKSVWLLSFVVPSATAGARIPLGVATTFALIVLTWPLFLWMSFA